MATKNKKDALKEAKELGLENLASLLEAAIDDNTEEVTPEAPVAVAEPVVEAAEAKTDVSIDTIFEGVEGLPEGFVEKAKIIFEAAVIEKATTLAKDNMTALEESITTLQEAKDEEAALQLDAYLTFVAESWYAENEVALQANYKVELAEDFVAKITGLLQEYNVTIDPTEETVVAELETKLGESEAVVEELLLKLQEAKQENAKFKVTAIIEAATDGMTDVEKDRFTSVLGEMEYTTDEDFSKKVDVLKSIFTNKESKVTTEGEENTEVTITESIDVPTGDSSVAEPKVLSEKMKSYVGALQDNNFRNKKK
jgi:hypothetical protein